jgi:hypothetical protein
MGLLEASSRGLVKREGCVYSVRAIVNCRLRDPEIAQKESERDSNSSEVLWYLSTD